MKMLLSALISDGAPHVGVVFGHNASPVPAGALAEAGAKLFAPEADQPSVGLLMTNDRPTVEIILGALVTGSRLVSLPLPGRGVDTAAYGEFLRDRCTDENLREVVVSDEYAGLLEGVGITARPHSTLRTRPLAAPSDAGFSLVQFTSGSTGPPLPVVVDDEQLGANVVALLATLEPRPGDAIVSWLPLAHDMGLIGMLLTGIAGAAPRWAGSGVIVLLDPVDFLRDPGCWLAALDHWRGTFTAAPDFGYRLAVRRPPSGPLDVSCVRCAIVGGEIVRSETLESFVEAYRHHGLKARAVCPAYGMAEVGLAVTLSHPEEDWWVREVSTVALADGTIEPCRGGDDLTTLVASGRPLPGYSVVHASPTGAIGPIRVNGPSLGLDGRTGRPLGDDDGWYSTGDVGFTDGGQLYVCGRGDDYLVAHGRNIYGPSIEATVGNVVGVREGRCTAVGLPTGEWAVVAEPDGLASTRNELKSLRVEIQRAAVAAASVRPDHVVLVEPGSLPLTPSGKLQRNVVRARLAKGDLSRSGFGDSDAKGKR